MSDLAIYRYKTSCMQQIQLLVSKGYIRYTSGDVDANKALNLVKKFDELYGIHLNKNQRFHQKKKGYANTKLIMYPKPNRQSFLWWLLVTEGKGQVETIEKLYYATNSKKRLEWFDDYELVLLNKKDQSNPTVTWRMTKHCYAAWNTRIRHAIRSANDQNIRQTTWSLHRIPGFSELRNQVKRLRALTIKEWQRSRKDNTLPLMPRTVTYVTHADTSSVFLSQIVRRMRLGLRPFPRREKSKVIIEK